MALWAQVALTAAGFLVACAMLILGTLTLVDRRANRMEDKIEAARKAATDGFARSEDRIQKLNDSLTNVKEDVAELKGRLTPPDPGPLSLQGRRPRGRRTS